MQIARHTRTIPRFTILMPIMVILMVAISWWLARDRFSTITHPATDYLNIAAERVGTPTRKLVEQMQRRLRASPDDWQINSQLGLAYLQLAREIADPTYYQKAEAALKKALDYEPEDYTSVSGMGALALARHQFQEGLEWGEHARQINPERTYAYGVIADAQIELGQYEEAIQTLQKMVDLRPDMSSYARISYIRELHGDMAGAFEMMQWAADGGAPNLENTAWIRTQLGNLYFSVGDLKHAEEEYLITLNGYPGYVYALAGLGRVRAAQGKNDEAIQLLNKVSEVTPLPEFNITLADIFEMNGQHEAAQQQFELLQVIQELYQANGVDMDLEIALFNADHGIDSEKTLAEAHQAYARRPSIYAADVLAWVLYNAGDYVEARRYSQEALRLGTKDALKLFHAGMIAYRLGDNIQARDFLGEALANNPYFSIRYSPEAQRILQMLEAGSS